ncbi:MAG: glycerophosphodiester phosphodiesterase family protein [Acidobacteriota bacterium]
MKSWGAMVAMSAVWVASVGFQSVQVRGQYAAKTLVAHRGASAYAPENTLEAYQLAIQQGADYVEQDLQITRDGVLVCLHDLTLERTTDIEEVFPRRYREVKQSGVVSKQWLVSDFTLAEIKKLDAGSFFGKKFAGARIPTWDEAIQAIRGQAGLFPETKAPGVYGKRGFDMEKMVLAELRRHRLDQPGADPLTPVVIQSFSAESLRRMAFQLGCTLPLVLLVGEEDRTRVSPQWLKQVRKFAAGIGPSKNLLRANPAIVKWAHQAGLSLTPYTFRSSELGEGFTSVREEMTFYLHTLGVEALFTNNPDEFPRR